MTLTCEAPAQPPPEIHWMKDVSGLEGLGGRRSPNSQVEAEQG